MRDVFFISDRTGLTVENIGNALLTQFPNREFKKFFYPFTDTEFKANKLLLMIADNYSNNKLTPIIFTSIMNAKIRDMFKLDYVCHIDYFELCIPKLEKTLCEKATQAVGMIHGLINKDKYYERIESIEYSLQADDGSCIKNYEQADVILLGVSRVGKTPTCLFLAVNYGLKAANYPFVETDFFQEKVPKVLKPYYKKLFGLTINIDRLQSIRSNRLPNSNYANFNTCKKEISLFEHLMTVNSIPFINVSEKSIEEISSSIIQILNLKR